MPTAVTSHFNIKPDKFAKTNAFDFILDMDARFFVDPFLLPHCSNKIFENGRNKILEHYKKILVLLSKTSKPGEATWREAERLLDFPEVKGFNLGYGKHGSHGSGIGPGIRRKLLKTSYEIVQKGIQDPVIFELLGIFEEGVGSDRISDMTCRILYSEFLKYSQEVFLSLGVKGVEREHKGICYQIPDNPFKPGEPIILVPKDILKDIPIAYEWSEIEHVCSQNREIRNKLRSIIGEDWKKITKKWRKSKFKNFFLSDPDMLNELISSYNESKPKHYDYKNDPSGARCLSIAQSYTDKYLITFPKHTESLSHLREVVEKITQEFCRFVEYNGMNKFIFKEDGSPKKEEVSQLLFYFVSDIYCEANNLDIARECNAGRGPVDFKFSSGRINIIVDLKLSTNKHLKQAYEKQIPIYQKSERSSEAIIIILKVTDSDRSINKLLELKRQDEVAGKETPKIIFFDATVQPSASKA